jgi:hypothetical protein
MTTLMRIGWGADNPSFREMFTARFIPGATHERANHFNELQLKRPRPSARRDFDVVGDFNISDLLAKEGAGSCHACAGRRRMSFRRRAPVGRRYPRRSFHRLPRSKPFVPGACAGLRSILRRDQPFPERPTGRGSVPPDVKDQVGLRLRTTVSSHSHRFKRSGHPFILTEFPSCDVNRCYLGRRFTSTPAVR